MKISEIIKSKIVISDIIKDKIILTKKKDFEYIGLCPFHDEKTPSFFVNDVKNFYYCFGCKAHGDVFSFVMEYEKCNYKDALKKLANFAGIILEKNRFEDEKIEFIYKIKNILKISCDFYKKSLGSSCGVKARNYLTFRHLNKDIINTFDVGYSPYNSNVLIEQLSYTFSEKEILGSGIFCKKNGKISSLLSNRIVFPIKNDDGDVVAFGGRTIFASNSNYPKYINSAESPIFVKSNMLYGFDNVIKNASHKLLLIVEGYLDVLTLYQKGIKYAVSPLGTAINNTQIKKIWSICSNPILCFDNDIAGITACNKLIYQCLSIINVNYTLSVLELVGGKDPDSIVKNQGVEFFKHLILRKMHLANYIFKNEMKKVSLNTPEKKAFFYKKLVDISCMIKDSFVSQSYKTYFINSFYEVFRNKKVNLYRIDKNHLLYFPGFFHNKLLLKLMLCIINFPDILQDNIILEAFSSIELPNCFEKFRAILLQCYYETKNNNLDKDHDLLLLKQKLMIKNKFSIKTFDEGKKYVIKFFKLQQIKKLRLETKMLTNNFLKNNNIDLLYKLIHVKELEAKIEKELIE